MPPHVRRGGTRGRSNTPRHAAQARAGLSAGRSAPRTQGKFAAFDEFCKRLIGMGADHAPPPSHRGQSLGFLKAAIGPSPDRQASLPPWPPVIADAQATGAKSLRQITAALNGRSIAAARAGEWAADGGEPLRRIG